MSRARISLDGTWNFAVGNSAYGAGAARTTDRATPPARWQNTITVPCSYQSAVAGLFHHTGETWFERRDVVIPADWSTSRIVICFEAVSYWVAVFVNDRRACEHEGGYLPFEADVTDLVRFDAANTVTVRVICPALGHPEFPFDEIPHGKQDWYEPMGGIWQGVFLEKRSESIVSRLRVTAGDLDGSLSIDYALEGPLKGESLELSVIDADGVSRFYRSVPVERNARIETSVDEPRLWHPENPHLYTAVARLVSGGSILDERRERFGIRTIGVRGRQLLLNGSRFYMIGVLDQDIFPHTGYTAPSREYLVEQFAKARKMGINTVRCHIKIPDRNYLDIADESGMLVWYDLPNWGVSSNPELRHHTTDKALQRAEAVLEHAVELHWNRPSVVVRSIVNEDWGPNLVENASHRRWLADAFRRFRRADPTRLWVDNSACNPNFHVQTDIEDYHNYHSIPDHRGRFDEWIAELAGSPAWSFATDNETGERTGEEAIVLSEFGNWGLPELSRLRECYGGDPPWFSPELPPELVGTRPHSPQNDAVTADGVERRFSQMELERVFRNFDELARATQHNQFAAVKYQIQRIRERPEIFGYVITELTDIHWESNGLLDMCRNSKIAFADWATVNCPDIVIPRVDRYQYSSGGTATVTLTASLFSTGAVTGARVAWTVDGRPGGSSPVGDVQPCTAVPLGSVDVDLPECAEARKVSVHFALLTVERSPVAHGTLELFVFPEQPDIDESAFVHGPPDAAVLDRAERGDRIVIVANEPCMIRLPGIELAVKRRTGVASGDWATNFNWVVPESISGIPTDGLLGFETDGLVPELVIEGADAGRVLAGIVAGWLYDCGAYAVRIPYGKGELIVTTFRIREGIGAGNPAAIALANGLLTGKTKKKGG